MKAVRTVSLMAELPNQNRQDSRPQTFVNHDDMYKCGALLKGWTRRAYSCTLVTRR